MVSPFFLPPTPEAAEPCLLPLLPRIPSGLEYVATLREGACHRPKESMNNSPEYYSPEHSYEGDSE